MESRSPFVAFLLRQVGNVYMLTCLHHSKSGVRTPFGALPWNLTTPIETDANSSEFIETSGVDFTN